MASFQRLKSGATRVYASADGKRLPPRTFSVKDHGGSEVAARKAAEVYAAEIESRKASGKAQPASVTRKRNRVTLAAFRADWVLTRERTKRTAEKQDGLWANWIAPTFGTAPVQSITAGKMVEWLALMRREGASEWTRKGAYWHLSGLLSAAYTGHGAIVTGTPPRLSKDELPTVPTPHKRKPPLEAPAAIVAASEGQWRIVWKLAAETGARWSEVAGIPVAHLDIADRANASVFIRDVVERDGAIRRYPKDKVGRHVPISAGLARMLAEHTAWKGEASLVFTDEHGAPLDYDRARRVFKKTVATAGYPSLKVHDLRRIMATSALEAGLPARYVCELGGWSSERMLAIYAYGTEGMADRYRAMLAA